MQFFNEEIRLKYNYFRNRLRELNIEETLAVVWAYLQFLQWGKKLPNNVYPPEGFVNSEKPQIMLSEWNLITIVDEAILHSQDIKRSDRKKLSNTNQLAKTANGLRSLCGQIVTDCIDTKDIFKELFRITHQQFCWQNKVNAAYIARYKKIWSSSSLSELIKNNLSMSVEELYALGMMFCGVFMRAPAVNVNTLDGHKVNLSDQVIYKFMELFSADLLFIGEQLKMDKIVNENFAYELSHLVITPMIRMDYDQTDCLVCPSTTLLFKSFTEGLYYRFVGEVGFDNMWGEAFEQYVEEVINTVDKNNQWKVKDDSGDRTGNTADFVVTDEDLNLFIECKTKKITLPSKIKLNAKTLEEDLEVLANNLIQTYKSIDRYKNGTYPDLNFDSSKINIPLVVLLEDWHTFLLEKDDINVGLKVKFNELLKQKLLENNLNEYLLDECPYVICSINELEKLLQLGVRLGFKKILFDKFSTPLFQNGSLGSHLSSYEEYQSIEFLFPDYLDDVKAHIGNERK